MYQYTPKQCAKFFARIEFPEAVDSDDCWIWRGRYHPNGYGVCSIGYLDFAHRKAYEIANGGLPIGLLVMHSCDVRGCVNPNHLSLGTCADNLRDMIIKHKGVPGWRYLQPEQVRELRKLFVDGWTKAALARRYNVAHKTISLVINGKTWRGVE